MDLTLPGIHHITAIAGDARRNHDFYTRVLGLRLVKLTVNFDAPDTYHFYFGDDLGHPGTVLTFFPFAGARRGRVGSGQVAAVAFSVAPDALGYWADRLAQHSLASSVQSRFGEEYLAFEDPDGLPLELVGSADERRGWTDGPIPVAQAIRGFHSATLLVSAVAPSAALLTETLHLRPLQSEGALTRYALGEGVGAPGALIDLRVAPSDRPVAVEGSGTVHHIAWRTPDDAGQQRWREALLAQGLYVTPVRDRQYFNAIYFREPGGILYEIATDTPGFATDETPQELGTVLKLPAWLEPHRAAIAAALPPLA